MQTLSGVGAAAFTATAAETSGSQSTILAIAVLSNNKLHL